MKQPREGWGEDFVEVEVPNTQLTGTAVFDDSKTAEAALIDMYSKLRIVF